MYDRDNSPSLPCVHMPKPRARVPCLCRPIKLPRCGFTASAALNDSLRHFASSLQPCRKEQLNNTLCRSEIFIISIQKVPTDYGNPNSNVSMGRSGCGCGHMLKSILLCPYTLVKRIHKCFNKPPKPRYECQYCYEHKRDQEFVARSAIPYSCQFHFTNLYHVCKACMDASIAAQLESKPLIEVGCPQCGVAWDPDDLKMLIGPKNAKRFRQLDRLAREQVLVPADLPDGASLDMLLAKGTRFCPWCKWAFVRTGGCDSMLCSRCGKCFNISYALILEDSKGNRAADVDEKSNLDEII